MAGRSGDQANDDRRDGEHKDDADQGLQVGEAGTDEHQAAEGRESGRFQDRGQG